MEIKNITDLQKVHEHFENLFTKQLDALGKRGPQSAEARIAAVRAGLESARNAVAAAERRHATLLKRAETEIAAHRETVARLEGELEGLDVSESKGSKKSSRAAKRR